ncbi:DNA-binding transcriptional activator DecR (plasmid) [Asticcacaulis sp. MM231]|jgi:Lrp/AsnC family transcriptional regulator|uniref:Lrp/AsnC family transcriptional regulator n=1 Tax=Asticcacaulis sp. MM231 TaxID=3157666 RepID=UPI0032D56870
MSDRTSLDEADVRILGALQEDGTLSVSAVSEIVHLSQNACWRRMKRLEEDGVISKRVTLLNPERLGLELTVFVSIKTSEHSEAWLSHFAEVVHAMPEVVEFYRMTGEVDYLLKLKVENMAAYDRAYKRLISQVRITDVSSAFAMEEIKHTTSLPLKVTM